MNDYPDFQETDDYENGFESVDSDNVYDGEGYLLDDSDEFDDWGDYSDEEFDEPDTPFGYGYDDDEDDYHMALDEIVEIIDIDIIVTNEGFLLKKEIHILADGSEVENEYIMEIGCFDGQIPF